MQRLVTLECATRSLERPQCSQLCDFLEAFLAQQPQGHGKRGGPEQGLGGRLQLGATAPPAEGQGPRLSPGSTSHTPSLETMFWNPWLIIHTVQDPVLGTESDRQ